MSLIFLTSDAGMDGAKAFQGVHMTIVFPCPISQHIAMTLYLHAFDAGCLNLHVCVYCHQLYAV